jgi:acyl-CoA synthetase (AMP-forming)/AMP-acid ligase II
VKRAPSKHLTAINAVLAARAGQDALAALDPAERLRRQREASDTVQPMVDATVAVIPVTVAGCAAEWLLPPGADHDSRILMIHGGGFIMCGLNSHRNTSAALARHANCAVLAIDYRLAPEHPFPAALDDCQSAWEFMLGNGPDGPAEAVNAYVMGDSAGGNLSAALMLRLRDQGGRQADGGILVSAVLDLTHSGESWISNNASDAMLGESGRDPAEKDSTWVRLYVGDADPGQPSASPLFAELTGLPPLLIMTGEEERLRDDSVRFHERAIDAGVISRLERWPHVYHAWTSVNVEVPEADEALRRMGEFTRALGYKKTAAQRFADFTDLSDAMAENARRWPDHPAIVDGETTLSWAEFDARLNQMAHALIARGVQPGDKVALLARNSLDSVVVMFGTLRAGACTVPLSGMASSDALAMMMDNSDSKLLFLESVHRELIDPVFERLDGVMDGGFVGIDFSDGDWKALAGFLDGFPSTDPGVEITPELGFNIIYSSGTTGTPKGILHARRLRSNEFPAGAATGYSPWCRTLVSTPLYSNTTMAGLLPTLGNGGCAVLMRKFDARGFLELAEQQRITHAMLVPVQYQRILDLPEFADYDLSCFQMKYCTSAPLREELKRHMFPHKLHTVGFPFPGNEVRIVDEAGREVPRGQPGEILGHSRNMMDGYFKAADRTDEASWHDEQGRRWQRSGDMGRLDEDGFLELLDRKKDMIISGGFNVFAADLEAVLVRHEQVSEAAVIAVPSETWGETPLAFVEPAPGASPDPQALREC